MGPPRRAAVLTAALVPLGTIAGHVTGYVLAGRQAGLDGTHGHLRPASWIAAASAAVALGWVGLARGARPGRLPVAWLVAGQAVLFLGLESAEHLAEGHGLAHLLAEPALRWGLLAQVAAAAALVLAALAARASGERVRALLSARRRAARRAGAAGPTVTVVVGRLVLASSASERGPPRAPVPV